MLITLNLLYSILPDVLLLLLQQVSNLRGSSGEVLEQVLLLLVQQVPEEGTAAILMVLNSRSVHS